ncbi:SGNH hydrolase-type esterase domain-containing protein [Infundibulicybe gibba]|nr:SGNH hydrolase-type esterase domain-containing protein [Infundibulicybe gibba]
MAACIQDVIMLFGDSITQGGWAPDHNGMGQHLSHVYARKLDVLNRGLSGYNTDWAIPVFKQCLAESGTPNVPKVRLLVIWFGANDACIKPSPQHVPLTRFISNLKHMVNLVQSPKSSYYSPSTRIILITPPPVNTHQRKADLQARPEPLELDRLFDTTKAYSEGCGTWPGKGSRRCRRVVELWYAAGEKEEGLAAYLEDGLHLNKDGYKIVTEALIATIKEKYPEVHYDNLEFVFSLWAEINWNDPAHSLMKRSN